MRPQLETKSKKKISNNQQTRNPMTEMLISLTAALANYVDLIITELWKNTLLKIVLGTWAD